MHNLGVRVYILVKFECLLTACLYAYSWGSGKVSDAEVINKSVLGPTSTCASWNVVLMPSRRELSSARATGAFVLESPVIWKSYQIKLLDAMIMRMTIRIFECSPCLSTPVSYCNAIPIDIKHFQLCVHNTLVSNCSYTCEIVPYSDVYSGFSVDKWSCGNQSRGAHKWD